MPDPHGRLSRLGSAPPKPGIRGATCCAWLSVQLGAPSEVLGRLRRRASVRVSSACTLMLACHPQGAKGSLGTH